MRKANRIFRDACSSLGAIRADHCANDAVRLRLTASYGLYQRMLFDARGHLVAVFVGWAAG